MAEVLSLFRSVAKGTPMQEVQEISILENKGLEGCIHGRPGSIRQVLLMDVETLEEFGLAPGRIKENITTRGLQFAGLQTGQRVKAGNALLEVHGPCEPCEFIEGIRPGLQAAMDGRRGILCRAIQTGTVRRGDPIEAIRETSGK